MRLTFLGAAQEVTGSSFLLEADGTRLLIDCGLFQGGDDVDKKNTSRFPADPASIKALLITHAHLDHVGRIPRLYREGFRGRIITHPVTADLMRLVLEDEEHIIRGKGRDDEPLFTPEELEASLELVQTVDYNQWQTLERARVRFHDAGHILGSAWLDVELSGQRLVFSGDLGNPPVPLLNPTELPTEGADFLILESTYGHTTHEPPPERSKKLLEHIEATCEHNGTMLIPSFAIERTQEILYEINNLQEHGRIPPIDTYLDSPLAIGATTVFRHHTHLMNPEAKALLAAGDDFFQFKGLQLTRSVEDSKQINDAPGPKLIIAGSGMMQGGRMVHHAKRYLSDDRNRLIFVGYQGVGTLGRFLFDHRHHPGPFRVRINGESIPVHAKIDAIGAYSAHADQPHLLRWVGAMTRKPQHIFLTHGEPDHMGVLATALEQTHQLQAVLPEPKESFTI